MKLIQCDGTPSARVGFRKGYRILYQNTSQSRTGYGPDSKVTTSRDHWDLVLVPKSSGEPPSIRRIKWEGLERHEAVVAAYMGADDKYHWYGKMPLPELDDIRQQRNLEGGDDRVALFKQYLDENTGRVDRQRVLATVASHLKEAALPILKTEIAENKYDQLGNAISSLRSIPGKDCTDYLLGLYQDEKTRRFARYALTMPVREEAKVVYLDSLRDSRSEDTYFVSTVEAVTQFHWTEAIPSLQKIMEHPYVPWHYVKAAMAVRALQDAPVPQVLLDAEERVMRACYDWRGLAPREEFESAVAAIRTHEDTEGVLLVALRIATAYGKMNNRKANETGVALLHGLPPDLVDPVLAHLAANVRESDARKRVAKTLESVRSLRAEQPT